MSATQVPTGAAPITSAREAAPAETRSKPIYLFAFIGAVLFVVAAQGWIRWFASSSFDPAIRTGPDHYGMLWYLRGLEVLSAASTVLLFSLFVVRPLIRERRLSFDGKLVIGMMIGYFWEPMVNYYNFTFAFNAHGVNYGTWANFIPGFSYPHQAYLPDGTLYAMPQYVYSGVLLSLIGAWWLKYSRQHISRLGPMGRWIGLFFGLALIWMPFEYVFFILPKVWIYESVVPGLSVFAGSWHQFPLYEGFIMALFGCGVTFLRVTRDDTGRTFVEQGSESISPRWRNTVSVFAVSGVVCLWTGISYFGPWTWLQVQATATARDAPSYMRGDSCGTGTPRACPNGAVPIPSRHSLAVGPADPRLPASVRAAQGR